MLEAAIRDAEQSQKLFLQRLFPSFKSPAFKKNQKHNEWLEEFASEANKWIDEALAEAQSSQVEVGAETAVDGEKITKLEGQVKHYKSVLAETVSHKIKF